MSFFLKDFHLCCIGESMYLAKLKLNLSFVVFLFCAAISALYADESIQAKLVYEVDISGPSVIASCDNALWVYSVGEKELWSLHAHTGTPLIKIPLAKLHIAGTLTALGCKNNLLLMASFQKDKKRVFFHTFSNSSHVTEVPLPGTFLVKDIFCNQTTCYVIRDSIYSSQNLNAWSQVHIPYSADIPKRVLSDTHYFSNWQDQFLVAQGSYFRGLAILNERLLLLDTIRAAVVTRSGATLEKWESWGFRRGNLLSPKGFALLKNGMLAISDTGLKLISFFDQEGQYFGSTGKDALNKRFRHPLDIATLDNTLYVVDFLENKLYAFDIELKPETQKTQSFLSLRENLFRHPDVMDHFSETRCLNCHDGLETYNLERFLNVKERQHHPLHKEVKQETTLPLWTGKKVDCFSCHHPHHQAPMGKIVGQFGDVQSVEKLPFQLRASIPELCLQCHQEKGRPGENHFLIKKDKLTKVKAKQVISCSQCHKMHQTREHLLKQGVVQLCTTCHGETQVPQSHPIRNDDKKVTCISCHSPHGTKKEFHFARHSGKDVEVCLGCHQEKREAMGMVAHLKIDPKVDTKKWPGSEVVCLKCHDPHNKKQRTSALCISCHKDRLTAHHEKNVALLYERAQLPVPLDIKLEDGKISCATCHDPHNTANLEKYLRPRREAIKMVCSNCHAEEGMDTRFNDYHKRQKNIKREGKTL